MRCADFVVKEPMVIGHECAGIVEEIGSEVKHLVPGDRVALEPGISCWRCDLCKEGRYNLCPEMKFFATPPVHGSLAHQHRNGRFILQSSLVLKVWLVFMPKIRRGGCDEKHIVVHPADLCFKLPDSVSLEEGAMWLVTMMAARAFGAPRIVIVDVDDNRLSVAQNLGADGIVNVSTDIQDVPKEVEEICKVMKARVDVCFDCAGFNKTMTTALSATRAGGKVCLVGMGHNEMTVPLTPAAAREVDVIGIFRYRNTWPLCIEFLRSGKIDVKPLITHRFGFSQKEVEEAFETSAGGGNTIKVMFNL
ncbi:GroES-like zinc-binding alcohol dehydrogenase family protein isoform 2 [Hibiscus syriacus]|uniref:GroES-like zinc-binding alcohol dehydrogenase family protein isoform 2 n=1 Tax=Hibiscus syriacus TaxID=106335 RepID=A0A6A2YSQ4_HIBSY|nr:GroES-like zinc-binding alcohol dehydrogenase family protein isoform 2 [Hibiscus syriacus]